MATKAFSEWVKLGAWNAIILKRIALRLNPSWTKSGRMLLPWNWKNLAEIDYHLALQGGKAVLSMHYSPVLEQLPENPWEILLPDGSFVIIGGLDQTNYESSATVFAFYPKAAPLNNSLILILGICLALIVGLLVFAIKKKSQKKTIVKPEEAIPASGKLDFGDKLKALMEEKQLFKNKDLRLADLAAELGTNTTYLSVYLNSDLNTTFSAFVTGYRIQNAQQLMRKNPSMRLAQVAEESGFTNEKTFLRAFKASCDVTPSEWKQGHNA